MYDPSKLEPPLHALPVTAMVAYTMMEFHAIVSKQKQMSASSRVTCAIVSASVATA